MRVSKFHNAQLAPGPRPADRLGLRSLRFGLTDLPERFIDQFTDCLRARWNHVLLPSPVLEALAQIAVNARMDGCGAAVRHASYSLKVF